MSPQTHDRPNRSMLMACHHTHKDWHGARCFAHYAYTLLRCSNCGIAGYTEHCTQHAQTRYQPAGLGFTLGPPPKSQCHDGVKLPRKCHSARGQCNRQLTTRPRRASSACLIAPPPLQAPPFCRQLAGGWTMLHPCPHHLQRPGFSAVPRPSPYDTPS